MCQTEKNSNFFKSPFGTKLTLVFFFHFSFSRNAGATSAQTLQKNLQSMKLNQPSGSRSMRV